MKSFSVKIIAYLLTVGLILFIPAKIVDPYNVFHAMEPRNNGIEANKSFIKTEYIKEHHEEFDALLFGSSRAGFVDISYLNEKSGHTYYDMASSESLVNEQVKELREFIRKGFVPKQVIVLVDDISCFVDPLLHENMLYRLPYPGSGFMDRAEFYLKYCDLFIIKDSMKVIKEDKLKKEAELSQGIDSGYDTSTGLTYLDRFYHTGTERLDKPSQFDPDNPSYQEGYFCDYYEYRGDEALLDMREMVELCERYDIELIVATNPLYKLTYDRACENGYSDYLDGLSDIVDYYDFSTIDGVTDDYHNYYETSHFMPHVTRIMIDEIYKDR